ncbi:putative uncharacterized protein DDB_G0291608 [Penaeus monodon]|uniref:putative uncharacterized protein DDB_G0291608 n=1 Tax=Penaeus monodon TaxID=6687 RepID=UPI0018A71166|nr:putative uncharacterized protein DDB_G0291608 [Penaeus monodon]
MDQERAWIRGRLAWSNESLATPLREGVSQPQRRMHHSGPPSLKFKHNRPAWDDSVHDLTSMRLTPTELARKLASRQSSNLVLARAQLLEQSRRPGVHSPNLPPSLAARLQAARQQSVESILAQSSATLLTSQKVRQAESKSMHDLDLRRNQEPDGAEDPSQASSHMQNEKSRRTPPVDHQVDKTESKLKLLTESMKENSYSYSVPKGAKEKEGMAQGATATTKPGLDDKRGIDPTHGASTRTSLDHTITMVVNTCRELWQQLEEERLTRERLTQQLQQQGNVITTLTTELLQIQEQQESILREVSDARASGLWGFEGDLSGGSSGSTEGDDIGSSHSLSGKVVGGRPSSQTVSSRHPQRSILRATRTIHTPHLRQQSPMYSTMQHSSRSHQSSPLMGLSHQAPHSPRPHQASPRPHRSPSPQSTLSIDRSESWSHIGYRSSVSRQIRDALTNSQNITPKSEISKSHMSFSKVSDDGTLGSKQLEKEKKHTGERQSIPVSNKENDVQSALEANAMDSTISDLAEKK